jgi:hypothetical protein
MVNVHKLSLTVPVHMTGRKMETILRTASIVYHTQLCGSVYWRMCVIGQHTHTLAQGTHTHIGAYVCVYLYEESHIGRSSNCTAAQPLMCFVCASGVAYTLLRPPKHMSGLSPARCRPQNPCPCLGRCSIFVCAMSVLTGHRRWSHCGVTEFIYAFSKSLPHNTIMANIIIRL